VKVNLSELVGNLLPKSLVSAVLVLSRGYLLVQIKVQLESCFVLGTASVSKWSGKRRVSWTEGQGSLLFPISHKRLVVKLGRPVF